MCSMIQTCCSYFMFKNANWVAYLSKADKMFGFFLRNWSACKFPFSCSNFLLAKLFVSYFPIFLSFPFLPRLFSPSMIKERQKAGRKEGPFSKKKENQPTGKEGPLLETFNHRRLFLLCWNDVSFHFLSVVKMQLLDFSIVPKLVHFFCFSRLASCQCLSLFSCLLMTSWIEFGR